ncbi:metalloregulator ArsR/SmtB family transcription factor [Deinococcus sp.]|uniref:helix-turn-helix transcriptional regulator n=1 Tax=Deinococcus sp. TaxID=47478 RepID=UPI0025BB1D58|nr:metalloregulator ArsR/SmtB family transcription factor [Deinococcus sp.]
MTTASALPGITERTKKRLLELVNRHGGLTAQELAQKLEVSVPAARRHLSDLQEQGLIGMTIERPSGRGRPQHVFTLTEQGEATFPKTYSTLCADILRHVEHLFGQEAVLKVFNSRSAEFGQLLRAIAAPELPLAERLERLAAVLTEAGFDAVVEFDGTAYYLIQRNCPNLAVARQFKALCISELNMYAEVLGRPIERDQKIACGQRMCRYRIAAL